MTEKSREEYMEADGTTPEETLSVIVPSVFYTVITTILVSLLSRKTSNVYIHFSIEFFMLVVPLILNVTLLSNYATEVLITAGVTCVTLILLVLTSKPYKRKSKDFNKSKTCAFITNSRSTINIISVIAILAVDFNIFPRRFAKTVNFGYSLMDVGVGLYIVSNAIVDSGKGDFFKTLKGTIPVFVLGLGRLIVTRAINYSVPVSEYGLHWNFFITLGVTKILVTLLFSVIDVSFIWINIILLFFSQEILLQSGLQDFVFQEVKRDTFLVANREGIVSTLGYVNLYLISVYFSYFIELRKEGKSKTMKFIVLSFLALCTSLVLTHFFGISRKLANSAYCFWILFIETLMIGLFYFTGQLIDSVLETRLNVPLQAPLIYQAINHNGLLFFLISNLLTGLVNIVCDTLSIGPTISFLILFIYMLVNCLFVCVLFMKKIKLKL